MSHISKTDAAELATDLLRRKRHLSPSRDLHYSDPVTVSTGCITDLCASGKISTDVNGRVDQDAIETLFHHTRVLDGTGLSGIRVSIAPLADSAPVDTVPGIGVRRYVGWDHLNRAQVPEQERRAGIEGVWPLGEDELTRAILLGGFLLPSMKGFVDGSLISRVTGYRLDLRTKRRWLITEPVTHVQWDCILPVKGGWQHAWVTVGRGRIAEAKPL